MRRNIDESPSPVSCAVIVVIVPRSFFAHKSRTWSTPKLSTKWSKMEKNRAKWSNQTDHQNVENQNKGHQNVHLRPFGPAEACPDVK